MPAPDSDSYVTLSSEEELGDHSHRQAPPGRKGGTLAAPALRPQRRRTARGLLSPGSQAAAQNSTAAYVLDQQEGSTRASSRLAAGRASGRAAGRQQRQRPGQAAALAELQQARAGRVAAVVAHPSGQRRSRAHAVVEDSSSSGSGSPPAGSDSYVAAEPWPRRRACRAAGGARSRTRFLRGGRDYAESGSDTDMADFIAGDGEEEPSASDGDGQQWPERGGGSPPSASPSSPALDQPAVRPGAHGRRAAAGARGLAAGSAAAAAAAAWDDDSAAEEGSGASGDAVAAQAAGPGEEQEEPADDGGAAPLRCRKRRAAALVVSSESEDEAAALGGDEGSRHAAEAGDGGDEGATATTPGGKRRRLRRVHGGSAPGSSEAGGDPSPGQPPPPPSPQQQQQQQQQPAPGSGSGDSLAARRQRRTPPPRPQLAAADRIRQAQQRWQRGGGPAGGSDGEEGEGEEQGQLLPAGEEEDVSVLTDEGDPDASSQQSQGSHGEEGGEAGQPRRRDPRGARQRRSGGDQGWQRAADVLGLGAYSPRQLFDIYVEYALLCYADPGYAESVRRSPTHEQYYRRALDHIEFEMTRLRGSVASDAWKSSARGLLQALEALPGIETGWTYEDGAQELAGAACDACNRSRSHATRQLILKGVPCEAPAWGDATLISNRRLSDQFATTSPVFKERQELPGSANRKRTKARLAVESSSEEEEEAGGAEQHAAAPPACYMCQRFHVGRFCCGRLALYHALFHWRRRLLARLKRELKAELRRRKRGGFPRDRSCVAEAVLRKESLMEDLYRNYRRLLELAERYQLSGGEESRGGWKSAFEGVHAEVEAARTELHSGSEAEEGSVAWPDEADASSGSDEEGGCQAGADGTGSDGDEGADRERPDGGRPRLRQARIRFGAVPLQPTAPPAQQRTGVGRSGDGIRKQGTPPAQGAQPEATAAQETPAPQRPSSAVGRIRRVDIRSFFSPRQQQRQQETQHTE